MKKDDDILSLNKTAWDNLAEKYEKHRPIWLDELNVLFDLFCSLLSEKSLVLDIGSGTGLSYAKLLIERGFSVLGIDIAPQMLKVAQRNVPQAEFKELSMTELNYENMFDGAVSSFSMLLLSPLQFKDVASRIAQALKEGGILYLSLNEPWGEDPDEHTIIEILGEKMYSRGYFIEEVIDIFTPLGMNLLKMHKELQKSEIFGEEHTVSYVFRLK